MGHSVARSEALSPANRVSHALGIDIAPGVWHTIAVLTPHAVCYEVKPGPYSAANDKDFAPWAPREGDRGVEEYLDHLISLAVAAR